MKRRVKYTLEFKMAAVRLLKGGQTCPVTAKILDIPKASLENWVRLSAKGPLKGASDKMERDILKKATAYFFARESL